jgi:hypothetical protein
MLRELPVGEFQMTRTIFIAAATVLLSTGALADPFEGLYGNTVTSTSPNGKKYVYYFNQRI